MKKLHRIKNNSDFIKLIAEKAAEYSIHPKIDEWADKIVGNETDDIKKIAKLYIFVRDRVKYNKDPVAVKVSGEVIKDFFRHPKVILERIEKNKFTSGDCDDKTLLLASLLLNRGYPVRIVGAEILKDGAKNIINHTYLEVKVKDKWYPLEPSSKTLKPFTQMPNVIPLIRVYPPVLSPSVSQEIISPTLVNIVKGARDFVKSFRENLEESAKKAGIQLERKKTINEVLSNPGSWIVLLFGIFLGRAIK